MTRHADVCLILSLWHGTLYLQSNGALCSGRLHNLVIYPAVSGPTNIVHVTAINSHNIWIIKTSYSWGVVFGTRPSRFLQNSSFFFVLFKTNILIFWNRLLQFRNFSNRFFILYEMLFNTFFLHFKKKQVGW